MMRTLFWESEEKTMENITTRWFTWTAKAICEIFMINHNWFHLANIYHLPNFLRGFSIYGLAAEIDSGYSAGSGSRLIQIGELGMALPLICYESVFARYIARVPGRADFLLLITNDAWFGDISGPYQHLAQARLRSAEFGLPMVRVANTGISAIIDARGRILASINLGEANWIDARLPDPLPPTIYSRVGDVPVIALALVLMGIAPRRKQVKASGGS